MRARLPVFITVVQLILIVTHFFLYGTWMFFWGAMSPSARVALRVTIALLSVSFVVTSLLAFRYSSFPVRIFYTLSAIWLGLVNFFVLAACACWITYAPLLLFGARMERRPLGVAFFGVALLTGIYGVVNASWTRVIHVTVKLPNLPQSWRGRTAALVSDLHLGHVRNSGFVRHIVGMLTRLRPDAVFLTGDLYDGSAVDLDRLARLWAGFSAPLGSYFVFGNHEQFSSPTKYLETVRQAGFRVVDNEKIIVDGLQIVGVHYWESVNVEKFQSILKQAAISPDVASILLVHAPDHLPLAAEAGISLQLSGHTHRGQFFPFTLLVSRFYGEFAYGLKHFGALTVYTSCGAGTWGPPLRVGTSPEIVMIRFE